MYILFRSASVVIVHMHVHVKSSWIANTHCTAIPTYMCITLPSAQENNLIFFQRHTEAEHKTFINYTSE